MFKKDNNKAGDEPCEKCGKKRADKHAKCSHKDCEKKAKKHKHHLIRNVIGLGLLGTATTATTVVASAVGAWGAWQYAKGEASNRRRHMPNFNKIVTANTYCGLVHKNADEFTLTTASKTYHIFDPLSIIDSLAKEQAEANKHDKKAKHHDTVSDYYDIEVCVLGELSQKGYYGYLGHLDYQLTIVGRGEEGNADTLITS